MFWMGVGDDEIVVTGLLFISVDLLYWLLYCTSPYQNRGAHITSMPLNSRRRKKKKTYPNSYFVKTSSGEPIGGEPRLVP